MCKLENILQYENQKVRTVIKENEVWFLVNDVCEILGIDNKQTRRLSSDEKGVFLTHTPGGKQRMTHVNEFGLYNLILGSRKKEAKEFKRWVTHEVLPSIRVSGGYGAKVEPVDEPFDPEWRGYAMRQLTMENDLLRGELDRYDDLFDNTKKLAETVLQKAVVKAEEVKKSSVVRGVRIDRRGTKEIIRERSDG